MTTKQSKVSEEVEYKAFGVPLSIDNALGIVECFTAVMGNKDHVDDVIMPGAFDASLKRRKPKVVWGHDWNHPIGKVLEIYEVPSSDPRVPMSMKAMGLGGLYTKIQFNLKSQKGREAFENVLFYGTEQEWSIGYKTLVRGYDPAMKANVLKELELYEVSPVLHGANGMTSTISIKSDSIESEDDDDLKIKDGINELLEVIGDDLEIVVKAGPGNADALSDAVSGGLLRGRGPRRGNLEDLLDYWRPIMKKPGGFRRCLVILADHPELYPLENMCAWLHHETTGKWPNEKSAETEEISDMDEKGFIEALFMQFGKPVRLMDRDKSSAVFSLEEDEDTVDGPYAVKYRMDEDGEYYFTSRSKVKPVTVWQRTEEKDDCDCGCSGDCDGSKSLTEEVETKAGRVISSSNLSKIRQAMTLLEEVVQTGSVETKKDVIEITGVDDQLEKAINVVNSFYGVKSEVIEGTMNVEFSNENHKSALLNVISGIASQRDLV